MKPKKVTDNIFDEQPETTRSYGAAAYKAELQAAAAARLARACDIPGCGVPRCEEHPIPAVGGEWWTVAS